MNDGHCTDYTCSFRNSIGYCTITGCVKTRTVNHEKDVRITYEGTTCGNLPKTEPAKEILVCMDKVLEELGQELIRIDSVIYSPSVADEEKNQPADECLLGTLNRQRATAQKLLDLTIHIREGLW